MMVKKMRAGVGGGCDFLWFWPRQGREAAAEEKTKGSDGFSSGD
jgi:hypothetical protein